MTARPSVYTIPIDADTSADAVDIAKRRARDEGFVVVKEGRVVIIRASTGEQRGRYSVDLEVTRQ